MPLRNKGGLRTTMVFLSFLIISSILSRCMTSSFEVLNSLDLAGLCLKSWIEQFATRSSCITLLIVWFFIFLELILITDLFLFDFRKVIRGRKAICRFGFWQHRSQIKILATLLCQTGTWKPFISKRLRILLKICPIRIRICLVIFTNESVDS